jgi:hypothetical protein
MPALERDCDLIIGGAQMKNTAGSLLDHVDFHGGKACFDFDKLGKALPVWER